MTSVTMIMRSVSHVVSGTSCKDISGKSRIDRSDIKSFVVVFKLKLLFISFTSQQSVSSEAVKINSKLDKVDKK